MSGYGDFAYYYDILTENVDYESRCDYIYNLLADNGVGKGILLDLACGTGTLSLMLEEKGFARMSLGPRILRTDTALIALISRLMESFDMNAAKMAALHMGGALGERALPREGRAPYGEPPSWRLTGRATNW